MRKTYIALMGTIAAAAAIVWIIGPERPNGSAPSNQGAVAEPAVVATGVQRRAVTRDTFQGDWPLVVDEATLQCAPVTVASRDAEIATVVAGGKTYALNGTAHGEGYADLGGMWLDNEDAPGAKVSVSDFIDAARDLCARK